MKQRYLLERELGSGGFGTVYLARDQSTGTLVAIKTLRDSSTDSRQRFRREALTLYRLLNNQFIVDLLDHDLDADPPYFVLEYCQGGSLRSWVGKNRAWEDVAGVLIQTILGLASIHENCGFHRDLKPDNILIASDPHQELSIRIADFGLARLPERASATITRTAAGTDGYIAPEVLGGAEFHSGADIYSLGIVMTELLTGARNPSALHGVKLPLRFRELILAMCSADSTKRPGAQQIAADLRELLLPRPAPMPAPAPSIAPAWGGVALLAAAFLGIAALADGNKSWDASVRRYRGSDGRFK